MTHKDLAQRVANMWL